MLLLKGCAWQAQPFLFQQHKKGGENASAIPFENIQTVMRERNLEDQTRREVSGRQAQYIFHRSGKKF